MASIYGKEEHDALNRRMEEKQPSTTQTSAKNSPSGQQQQLQRKKAATSSEQGQRKGTSHKLRTRAKKRHKPQTLTARATRFHGKCISDGQNNDGIHNREEARLKYQK
ncbi:hypothetical protein O181_079010 [Austropuccinia psidii MF-1]|uniref:Uncharacterized protein n=1 Tax=Austropuccinia psidii MF-1 TaxID=1389203 RepID=A0A9Q3FDY7_9BASI|nr:hypothetical protein [Austropuccinia psidii MF-1]